MVSSLFAVNTLKVPDKLNTILAHFEEKNTEPPMWAPATHENCVLLISIADVSKTFKSVNPPVAWDVIWAGIPSQVLRACAD